MPLEPARDASPGGALAFSPGLLGPRLMQAGAIDAARFIEACTRARAPLSAHSRRILLDGCEGPVGLDASNAHFVLNLLWAVGLANTNPLLTRGPMFRNGMARIPGYASTGGWVLGTRPVMEIYAHLPLVTLTTEQQARLEDVSSNVYRPCCDNPTSFPDCNHGMAMLGLLTLLAAENREADALFRAAKVANHAWFPAASRQVAAYSRAALGVEYERLEAREASGRKLFSASGLRNVAAWLRQRGLVPPAENARC